MIVDKLNSMNYVPVGIEVLAYHKEGRNFHPVKFDDTGKARMRWHDEYSQYVNHFSGWLPMPVYKS